MLAPVPPIQLGQLVTIRTLEEALPGTVTELTPVASGRWEIRVEVLANFGIGTSRHIVDGAGQELDSRSVHLDLPRPAHA